MIYLNRLVTRQITGAIITLPPIAAWLVTGFKLYHIEGENPFVTLFWMARFTPQDPYLLASLFITLVVSIGLGVFFFKSTKRAFKGARYRRHLRGTEIVEPEKLAKLTKSNKDKQITIAGIPFPVPAENLQILLAGGTGAGKTTIFNEIMLGIARRKERCFILDPAGSTLSKFYKEGDVILNPYDKRTQGWSFFNEIRNDYDFDRLSMSIIPKGKTEEAEEWASYGRLLFKEVSRKLWQRGTPDIEEVHYWCSVATDKDLRAFLEGTQALSLFAGSNEGSKALTSARFVLSDKLPEHVKMPEGDFSLRKWLENPNGGNLYITWREDQKEALKPLISAWVDVLYSSTLSLPEDLSRRIWSLVDELGSLEKLATLEDALTKGRKFGLRIVAGIQSTSQLADIYGREGSQTLRSCFSSMVAMRVSRTDPETAEDFSKSIGVHEVERDRDTSSRDKGQRSSSNLEVKEERVVSPAELINLQNLTGYLAIVGGYPVTKFETQHQAYKTRCAPFEERNTLMAQAN